MITPQDYETLRKILAENSGHALSAGKEYLIERRLGPVASSLSFPDIPSMVRHLRLSPDRRTVGLVCEAMTTNESLFFRDQKPFDLLKSKIIPELMEARRAERRLRIWSAAASTGQEAYSIAMTLIDNFPQLESWDVEILGTDYSRSVVERARQGVFNHFEVQRGLPVMSLMKHFSQAEEGWQANERLRRDIRFQEGNLLERFRQLGPFDLVFCRNVLIYFDAETKADVLTRIAEVMKPDARLFLGASETVFGLCEALQPVDGANTTLYELASNRHVTAMSA